MIAVGNYNNIVLCGENSNIIIENETTNQPIISSVSEKTGNCRDDCYLEQVNCTHGANSEPQKLGRCKELLYECISKCPLRGNINY